MHPATPFNTKSKSVWISELAGWLSVIAFFYWHRWQGVSLSAQIALVITWAGYLFMRFCSIKRWHKDAQPGEGIEQQFTQVAVAAIYGFLIATLAAITHSLSFLIYPVAAILATVSAINATLIYLYHKDTSTVPINYYSHHKLTQEDA